MIWKTVKINDVCLVTDYVANGSFKSLSDNVEYLTNDGYAILVRLTDFTKGWNGNYKYVDEHAYNFLAKTKLFAGDLLISNVGEPGKTFLVPELEMPMTLGPNSILVRPNNNVLNTKFFKYLIDSLYGKSLLDKITSGTTQKKFNKTGFRNLEIPLPPLAEQERIVAKLDAAFAEIDEAIVVASNKEKNAEKLFENYLSNIFQINNQDWKSDNLENITSKIGSGATPRGGQASYKKDGISLIRSMNVHDMYFKYKNLAKIDNEQASKLSNVTVQENDILLNITGASVARCCLVERDVLPARVNQHVSIIRVKKEIVIPKFIVYGLISKPYKDKLLTVGNSGGATRQAITKTQIEDFIFYYPKSKKEQNNLITKLDSVYLHTQNLAEIYKKQIKQHVQLKLAILSQELQSSEAA